MSGEAPTDAQAKQWRLRRSPLFDCLSDGEIKELASICRVEVLERGGVAYEAGEPGETVLVVESGAIKLTRVNDDGREVTVAVLGPAEVFGERALVGEASRGDRASALEDTVLCALRAADLEGFLFAHPQLALRMTKLMGERLQRVESRIQDILFKDVRTRLAHTVAHLAEKFGQDVPEGRRIGLRLTQTELAQLIGSTRETTSTIFNEFRRDGLLDSDDHYIVVRDLQALATY